VHYIINKPLICVLPEYCSQRYFSFFFKLFVTPVFLFFSVFFYCFRVIIFLLSAWTVFFPGITHAGIIFADPGAKAVIDSLD